MEYNKSSTMETRCTDDEVIKSKLVRQIVTFVVFSCTVFMLPSFFFCYFCVQILRNLWLKLLSNRFPHLVFVEPTSIRTLLDNHRNQGVINVLLTIKGPCEPLLIHQTFLDSILNKTDRRGNLLFPKLRAGLISCWGNYAWRMDNPFNLENHLTMGNPTYRGRPITDHNIQDYVNDIVKRYLPSNMPPWQMIIIPNYVSNEPKYCILFRVHHLLIADDEPLNLGDFLLLKPEHTVISDNDSPLNKDTFISNDLAKSPLCDLSEKPVALPKLFNLLSDCFSNKWNEFISEYDPVESPKIMKHSVGFTQCVAIIIIALASVGKELTKGASGHKSDPASFILNLVTTLHKEISRRGLTISLFLKSFWVTFNPISILFNIYHSACWLSYVCTIKYLYFVYNEVAALFSQAQYPNYQDTFVAFIQNYLPLLYSAAKELAKIVNLLYHGPMSIICEIILLNRNAEEHHLQSTSLCGRKVIAWSHPISRKAIGDVATKLNVSETEILLHLTSNGLNEYFEHAGAQVPKGILMTARTTECDTLLASMENNINRRPNSSEGLICFPIPVDRFHHETYKDLIAFMNKTVHRIREKQALLYAMGGQHALIVKVLPSVMARLLLNYLSRKFCVSLIEVAENGDENYRSTQWGQTVHSFLCWRPPQGNVCVSLTLQRYADAVRIGVMTDALLSPHHMVIARHWHKNFRKLSSAIGIPHHSPKEVGASTSST